LEPASKPEVVIPNQTNPDSTKPEDLKKTVELAKEAQETQQEIVKLESSLSQIKQQAAQPGVDPKTYVEDFEDLLTQLQKLNEKASETAKELAKVSKTQPSPQSIEATQNISAAPIKAKSIPTLKLTSFPNVINGIVTDSLVNYIEGAIVVAHDRQGLPVRALKSNKLGQFVAATPLPNGEYTIMVEKDNLLFDKISLELTNEILPPILVAAKKLQQQVNQIAR
jgi:predicted RNase H-like nuclease (RuvC/YqgF family)